MSRGLAHEYWFPWETALWRGDTRLRMCSAAARGVWVEFIMCMRDGKPGGYLTDPETGKPLSLTDLVRITGYSPEELQVGIEELRTRGVFSIRAEDGAIYSRKIVREMAISQVRSNAGRRRSRTNDQALASFAREDTRTDAAESASKGPDANSEPEHPDTQNQPISSFAAAKGPTKSQQNVRSKILDLSSSSGEGECEGEPPSLLLADALLASLLSVNPEHDHKRSWDVAWRAKYASDLRLIERPHERAMEAIRWFPTDDFWRGSISDSVSFVRNFRSLETKMLATKQRSAGSNTGPALSHEEWVADLRRRGFTDVE